MWPGSPRKAVVKAWPAHVVAAIAVFMPAGPTRPAAAAPQDVDFGRDVLPLLSDNCFPCHGPDEKARKAKLRLDTEAGAKEPHDGESAVVPGDLAKSALVARITAVDDDERMPPVDSKRKLTDAQIDLIKRWISEGAKWGRHWAYDPP